ncbi:MAG: SIS domain-containing protein [Acidobacteria bacterium]|nr:SIS domain-containing protein [Acidobacteriota bacterium]
MRLAAAQLRASCRVKQRISPALLGRLAEFARLTLEALARGRRVYLFGNGGSAADAQHIAAELQGRLRRVRPALPALALTTNTSVLTAIGNDTRFADVFARQVEGLAGRGDIVVGLTTSGASANVLAGLRAARRCGARTVALTGARTEKIKRLADVLLAVPSRDTQRIQEAHITLGHIYCELIERHLFGR